MDTPKISPDQIREVALNIIHQHPQGIRQIDLIEEIIKLHKSELAGSGDPLIKVRNAVWNIAEKFPYEVSKNRINGKKAILIPRSGVTRAVGRSAGGRIAEASPNYDDYIPDILESTWLLLSYIEEVLDVSPSMVDTVVNVKPADLAILSEAEMSAVMDMRNALISLKKCRETVAKDNEKKR